VRYMPVSSCCVDSYGPSRDRWDALGACTVVTDEAAVPVSLVLGMVRAVRDWTAACFSGERMCKE